ncbi:MAG: nickel-dependent hydrogenase large subunit [Magnetococcus sp. YQC-9]
MTTKRVTCDIPLNRVEGDLEIKVALEGGRVVDAWSSGTMFRGFERIMEGRGPLDGLVITPRICGICSLTHLYAAARALDQIYGVAPPANAVRLRNLALMVETVQSDVRQSLLMFLVDFANPAHAGRSFYPDAVARYEPLRGARCLEAVRETKQLLEIVAIIGGQWPHTSFMVPGGVVFSPALPDLFKCRNRVVRFKRWYEETVLGCSLERWQQVDGGEALDRWLGEQPAHRAGDVGQLLRMGGEIGLDALGQGPGRFLSVGSLPLPSGSAVSGWGAGPDLVPAGFVDGKTVHPFSQQMVSEHVAWSWYADQPGGLHPFASVTDPVASGAEGHKYSWVKAPRYFGLTVETGPLAEGVVAGHPLLTDLVRANGPSALTRQLARLIRPALMLPVMERWIDELIAEHSGKFYQPAPLLKDGQGVGLIQAARGALGHWVTIEKGRIARYQIITPTGWNGSPRDANGVRGPWEEALLGTPLEDPDNPVMAGHVIRSFDPCLVCAVHVVGSSRRIGLAM